MPIPKSVYQQRCFAYLEHTEGSFFFPIASGIIHYQKRSFSIAKTKVPTYTLDSSE